MKKINLKLLCFFLLIGCLGITKVRADWAGCYAKMNKDEAVSIGDTFTYDLGIDGNTTDISVYGLHYVILYDQNILEPVSISDGGVGSYYNWENISSNVYEEKGTYNRLVVDIKTNDKNKFLDDKRDIKELLKIGYVKFKVKDTKKTSTKIMLYQTYREDLVNGSFYSSSSSYYYAYSSYAGNKQSPCYTEITTYINIYNKDSDATLKDLKVNEVDITPKFNKNTLNYEAIVKNEIDTINIEATCNGNNCKVKGTGKQNLSVGNNTFKVEVTSERGNSQTYTININRKEKTEAYLESLSIKNNKLSPEFNPDNLEYILFVSNDVKKLDLSYVANDKNASVKIVGNENFVEGNNEVKIIVSNSDNDSKAERKYHINVIKEKEENTTLIDNNTKLIKKQRIIMIILSSILVISNILWIVKVSKLKKR